MKFSSQVIIGLVAALAATAIAAPTPNVAVNTPEKRGCGLDLSQDIMSVYLRKSSDIELKRLIDDLAILLNERKSYGTGLKRRDDDDDDDDDDDKKDDDDDDDDKKDDDDDDDDGDKKDD